MPDVSPRPVPPGGEPAPGLVSSVRELGQGHVPVVLLTGAGVPATSWHSPLPEAQLADVLHAPPWNDRPLLAGLLAEFTRVVSYERAGMGESAPPGASRGLSDLQDELSEVLDSLGNAPAVLVGHSIGGPLAYSYARRYPARVAGLVLLDPSHPDQMNRFAPGATAAEAELRAQEVTFMRDQHPERLDLAELLSCGEDQLPSGALGDLPLAVVTGAARPGLARGQALYPDMTAGRWQAIWSLFAELHQEYLSTSTDARFVLALFSGHYPHLDQPLLVAEVIRSVWEAARARQQVC